MLTQHGCFEAVSNPAVEAAKAALDRELEVVTRAIEDRNKELVAAGLPAYEYMLPSQVICSPNT
jgi:hypothetical protein